MTKEDDIKALTYDLSPPESEEEEQRRETGKEIHEEGNDTHMEEEETQPEKEENQIEKEKHDTTRDEPKAKKRKVSKVEKGKTTTEKKNKPRIVQKKVTTEKEEAKKLETEEAKPAGTEKIVDEKKKHNRKKCLLRHQQGRQQLFLLHLVLQPSPNQREIYNHPCISRLEKSTTINMGKPQRSSREPIIIEDSHTTKKEESPSKTPITYERGIPKTSTWKQRIKLQDSKTVLQEAQTALLETWTKLQEIENLEKKVEEQTKEKDKEKEIPEPNPQPNLGSYYNLLEGGKIIPQNFAVPLFFELEKERVRSHRWMQITKSKGVDDIGHMENKLREMGKELSTVRHIEGIRRSQLEE